MNIIKAKEILEGLKNQLKEAKDQVTLYNGAVQGAEAILAILETEEMNVETQSVEEMQQAVQGLQPVTTRAGRKKKA